MKNTIIIACLVAVLTLSNIADACSGKKGHHKGVTGTVKSVGKTSLSLSVPSAKGSKIMTVSFTPATTVVGSSGHSVTSALVGHSVSITGAGEGSILKASEIVFKD